MAETFLEESAIFILLYTLFSCIYTLSPGQNVPPADPTLELLPEAALFPPVHIHSQRLVLRIGGCD
jgi:hypothetical protein